MEQQEVKHGENPTVEPQSSESSPMDMIWQGYSRWLNQFLEPSPLSDPLQVNNNPYSRGGTCSYDMYLSGMLRAHGWGLLLPAIIAIAPMYLFAQVWTPSQYAILGIVLAGLIHWAFLAFTNYEKRLQASGFDNDKSRLLVVGILAMFCCGYLITWYMALEKFRLTGMFNVIFQVDQYQDPSELEDLARVGKFWLEKQYDRLGYTTWIIIGQVMLSVGLALIYLLPNSRNSDALPTEITAELNQKSSYPTAVSLLLNLLVLAPIAMFLI